MARVCVCEDIRRATRRGDIPLRAAMRRRRAEREPSMCMVYSLVADNPSSGVTIFERASTTLVVQDKRGMIKGEKEEIVTQHFFFFFPKSVAMEQALDGCFGNMAFQWLVHSQIN